MDAHLDTLASGLYVKPDDALRTDPGLSRSRPPVGISPKLSDEELLTLAVIHALLGFISEAWFLRYAFSNLAHLFSYLPKRSGYNRRLVRASAQFNVLI